MWIVAADALVLPYRLIWSSGVCERATLYHRPVIASRIGGLADQVAADAVLVDDDDAARRRDARARGPRSARRRPGSWPTADRDAVMAEIRAVRAARRRPTATRVATGTGGRRVRATARTAPLRRLSPLVDARGALGPARRVEPEAAGAPAHRLADRPDHRAGEPSPAGDDRRARRLGTGRSGSPHGHRTTGRPDSGNRASSGARIGRIRTVNPSSRRCRSCRQEVPSVAALTVSLASSRPSSSRARRSPRPASSRPAVRAAGRRCGHVPADQGRPGRQHLHQLRPGSSITSAFSSPAVGDVTGDGVPEIVTGGDGRLHAHHDAQRRVAA